MREDLDQGLDVVAVLRGATRSGLVSQYAAEQIRVEQGQDRVRFAVEIEEIQTRKDAEPRKKAARTGHGASSKMTDDSVQQGGLLLSKHAESLF